MKRIAVFILLSTVFFISLAAQTSVVGRVEAEQSDGKSEISMGATLYIGNNLSNPAGFYSGSYEVVFTYN